MTTARIEKGNRALPLPMICAITPASQCFSAVWLSQLTCEGRLKREKNGANECLPVEMVQLFADLVENGDFLVTWHCFDLVQVVHLSVVVQELVVTLSENQVKKSWWKE